MKVLDAATIDALMRAEHTDPYAVLGQHADGEAWAIRTLLPGAITVTACRADDGTTIATLKRQATSDVFAARIEGPHQRFAYRLQVLWASGASSCIEDPYRFAPLLTDMDLWLLAEGTHHRPFERLGAHLIEHEGVAGVRLALWAPNARRVSVVGDFNGWDPSVHPLAGGCVTVSLPPGRHTFRYLVDSGEFCDDPDADKGRGTHHLIQSLGLFEMARAI